MIPADQFVELDRQWHDRKSFHCGAGELDRFLVQFAARHREAGVSKTMVLPARNNKTGICAYYTLSHTEIARQSLPKTLARKLPCYPVPVMLIAQLAVHQAIQGHGLGKVTLIRALQHCLAIHQHLPSFAVVVDVLNDEVQGFYAQYGFSQLVHDNGHTRLFIAMKTIEQLFA